MPLTASIVGTPIGAVVGTVVVGVPGTLTSNVGVPGPQGPQGIPGPPGPAGEAVWGTITGVLTAQLDLAEALGAKYDATNPDGFQTASEVSSAISSAVADYLPLAGGTMTGNLSVTATSNSGVILVQADEGTGDAGISVDNGGGQQSRLYSGYAQVVTGSGTATLNPTFLTITNGTTSVTADAAQGFKFPDDTWQTTAFHPADYLKKANNLSELTATASTARTNLGLGSMATQTASDYLDKAGNLAGLGSASVARSNLGLGSAAVQPDTYWIQSPSVAATDGQIPAWDAATSRSVWIDNAARSLFLVGVNKSGVTIPKGAAVYVSGGQGGTPIISLAQANSDATSAHTIGITAVAIANNASGNVVVGGTVGKLDTSAYADGQILYLSPTTPGGFVTSLPTQPYHGVVLGYVTRSNNSNGTIEVAINNYQELSELSDVLITSLANGDLLSWDATAGVWKNKTVAALGLATQSYVTSQGYITSSALTPYLLSSTASSTYQTQAGMTDYLPKAGNLAGLGSTSTARTNLGLGTMAVETASNYALLNSPTFSGTPSLPTGTTAVTQSINDNSTKLMTTAGLRDNFMDGTLHQMPITTATTATSGTGAAYVAASPDYGYLTGPNANIAGYCQKGFIMFSPSNSIYGWNGTKEARISCKMAIGWNTAMTGITYTLFHRANTPPTNGTLTQAGYGISINMTTKVLSILAHNGTTLTTKATSWSAPATSNPVSIDFMVKTDGAGNVYAYADGVLIDSTTGMATSIGFTASHASVEINSAGGTSTAGAVGFVSNLKAFHAHG